MKIIACLGNPDRKYINTRHNIGFIIGGNFISKYSISAGKKSFSSVCGTGKIDGNDILIMFPHTYMNSSGTAVKQALDYYREVPENIIVIHDEIELPFGEFNHKFGGGHRGHNGLRSIIEKTGSRDFHRIRFGVGRSENPKMEVADHVLSNFKNEELTRIQELMPEIFELIFTVVGEEKILN